MMFEAQLRHDMAKLAKSLFERGYSVGSAGNISARVADGLLITPTNSSLGDLEPERISKLDLAGNHIGGDKPSKEVFLHQAFYRTRHGTGAVVHLHSTYATLLSCRTDIDPDDCIPPLTPYVVMRVGKVKLLPYFRPGDPEMGHAIAALTGSRAAVLLANHGPVVAAGDLRSAVYAADELEETAKLITLLGREMARYLTPDQVKDLEATFPRVQKDLSFPDPVPNRISLAHQKNITPFLD